MIITSAITAELIRDDFRGEIVYLLYGNSF